MSFKIESYGTPSSYTPSKISKSSNNTSSVSLNTEMFPSGNCESDYLRWDNTFLNG